MKHFITPEELYHQMDDCIILDARGFEAYDLCHIPHAHAIDMMAHMSGPIDVHGGRHPLPSMDILAHRLSECGITMDSFIVVYDSWLSLSGRLWWMLRYMGFSQVKVLAGGIEAWHKLGYDLTKEVSPTVANPIPLAYTLQEHMVMSRQEVLQASEDKSHIIVDARSPERYAGTVPDMMDGMTGHIPTAINHFYEEGFTASGIRPIEELETLFSHLSHTDRPIVTYCGSGVTACNLMLTLAEVDIHAALYVGSSSDWVTYENFPITKGIEVLS